MSVILAISIMDRALTHVFNNDIQRKTIIRSMALEAIAGHMSTQRIHSIEAGIILIADGCDMTKGRARIPIALFNGAMWISNLLGDPIDLLSSPTDLFTGFMWLVLGILCLVELICYFSWHSKAKIIKHSKRTDSTHKSKW